MDGVCSAEVKEEMEVLLDRGRGKAEDISDHVNALRLFVDEHGCLPRDRRYQQEQMGAAGDSSGAEKMRVENHCYDVPGIPTMNASNSSKNAFSIVTIENLSLFKASIRQLSRKYTGVLKKRHILKDCPDWFEFDLQNIPFYQ